MNHDVIRQQLLQKQSELQLRMDAIHRDLTSGRPADFAEQVTASENDDVLRSLEAEANTEIVQIKRALLRLETDEYGFCERCGRAIPTERLAVLPEATTCTQCH